MAAAPQDPLLLQEAAAAASGRMLRIMLRAQRGHTGSASENHFRRAESQFFRMLGALPMPGAAKLDAVEYCFAPRLVAAFEAKRAAFDARYGEKGHQEVRGRMMEIAAVPSRAELLSNRRCCSSMEHRSSQPLRTS